MNKVILLAPTPPPMGGIAAWTVRMINAELPHNWEVEVVDEKIIGKREFFGNKTKLDIKSEVRRCFGIWRGLRKALKQKDAKVVHACIAANTLPVLREIISAQITRNRRRKFIIHFRCTVPNIVKGRINRLALRILCNKADCVMLLNKQSEDYIKKITKTRTEVIPNFVESAEIEENHVTREHIEKVLYVGGVIESKGCIDIIEAAKSFPNIKFKMIGNAKEACVVAADKVPNVILSGTVPHDEIKGEMANADIFMFVSRFPGEGFSNALAEAMAAGLPCIVSDWAANRDMIEDKGGVVVPPKDIGAIKNALVELEGFASRKAASKFNITKVKRCYTAEIVQAQYVRCYEELINE